MADMHSLSPVSNASTPPAGSRRRAAGLWSSLAALLLLGSAACGSGPPPRCETMPGWCDSGTTCWPVDQAGNYQCLESKIYKGLGSDCALITGSTTCGDTLICAPMKDKKDVLVNRCTPLCDDKVTCPSGATCTAVTLFPTAPQVKVCILPPQ